MFFYWELISVIEHSANKITMQFGMFEEEIRPGVLQFSVQQTCMLQECDVLKGWATDYPGNFGGNAHRGTR